MLAGSASAQDLTLATSMPSFGFPFFVHMQKELEAEAKANMRLASVIDRVSTIIGMEYTIDHGVHGLAQGDGAVFECTSDAD